MSAWDSRVGFSHLDVAGATVLIFLSFRITWNRSISIMKVARAKLSEIGPDDVDMEEYKVRDQRAASDPSHCPSCLCPYWEMGSVAWSCVANTVVTACLLAADVCRRVLREKEYTGNLSLEECLQLAKFIYVSLTRDI